MDPGSMGNTIKATSLDNEGSAAPMVLRNALRDRGLELAVICLSLIVVPAILHGIMFLVGLSMTLTSATLGLALGALAPLAVLSRCRNLALVYAVIAIILSVTLLVVGSTWDNSNDSLLYHEPAAAEIASGHNPVQEPMSVFWAEHYPKAGWIFSASTYAISGNIETGKLLGIVSVLACLGFTGFVLLEKSRAPLMMVVLTACLASLSPIAIVQLNTHYIDIVFASLSTILIMLALFLDIPGLVERAHGPALLAVAASTTILIVNMKFTGLVFAGVVFVGLIIRNMQQRRGLLGPHERGVVVFLLVAILGSVVCGISPYATNTLRVGNPLYPVFGADESDMPFGLDDAPSQQAPIVYRAKPAPLTLFMSISERTTAATPETMNGPYAPKNPFSVTRSEIVALMYPDPRRGGFGPLFALALALSVVILFTSRFNLPGPFEQSAAPTLRYGLLLVTISTLSMLEPWWARWAPMFFLFPVLVAFWGTTYTGPSTRRALSIGILVVLGLNATVALGAQGFALQNQAHQRAQFALNVTTGTRFLIRYPDPYVAASLAGSIERRLSDQGYLPISTPYDSGESLVDWVYFDAVLGEVRIIESSQTTDP